jgi:hypothetical protein
MVLEETLVRAGLALGQKKFTNSLLVKSGASEEDLDEEYHRACTQVVRRFVCVCVFILHVR